MQKEDLERRSAELKARMLAQRSADATTRIQDQRPSDLTQRPFPAKSNRLKEQKSP